MDRAQNRGRAHRVYLWAALIVLAAMVLLWYHWAATVFWARGADMAPQLLPHAILPFMITISAPMLLFTGWILSRRRQKSLWFRGLIAIGSVAGVVASLLLAYLFELRMELTPRVTNPARYQEILDSYPSTRTRHFPPAISPHATQVRFSYSPGPLQAASHVQLRLKLPPAEVATILETYSSMAKAVHRGREGDLC
jgi:hypothetical protein